MYSSPFLQQVTAALHTRFGSELYGIAMVFPNRRQAVYSRQYLLEQLPRPALLPDMLTIEELVSRCSNLALADPLRCSLALYKAYRQQMQAAGNTQVLEFEAFYNFGNILISDFSELDAHCAPVEKVFSIIGDYKEVEQQFDFLTPEQRSFLETFWKAVQPEGKYQEKFFDLWKQLPAIYVAYTQALEQQGFTTLGRMYRQLATAPQPPEHMGWQHVAFVGMNALNGAEARFIAAWQQQGLASFWPDVDAFYTDNQSHEAGFFYRNNQQRAGIKSDLPPMQRLSAAEAGELPAVQVTRVNGHVAQTKLVAEWMQALPADIDPGKAAVLLGDEQLLLPVLQSIPPDIEVNVTMGLPLAQSPLYSLVQLFFAVQAQLEGRKPGKGVVHWEQAMAWLQHALCDMPPERIASLRKTIILDHQQHVPVSKLLAGGGISRALFTALPNRENLLQWLRQLAQAVAQSHFGHTDSMMQSMAATLHDALVSMEPLYADFIKEGSLAFVQSVMLPALQTLSVPFESEQTAGIQVMGLLESRGLDFEHILLLGAGEGFLPRVAAPKTFIPYNLRKAFGLSTIEHQDAIFAYVFYRLLHRCATMHAVYNGLISDSSTGEVSRFIRQLDHETQVTVQWHSRAASVQAPTTHVISIPKDDHVLRLLSAYYAPAEPRPFSPSAINQYLSCRLQFFFNHLVKLRKPDEMPTIANAAVFGSAVHALLEELYKGLLGNMKKVEVTAQDIDVMIQAVPGKAPGAMVQGLEKAGVKNAQPTAFKGFDLVIQDVVTNVAIKFLEIDRLRAPFWLRAVETNMQIQLPIVTANGVKNVVLGGNIDRIDEKDGVARMVDYKTGGDKTEFPSMAELWVPHGEKRNKGALQTMLYALMFSKEFPEVTRFEPALVVLRSLAEQTYDDSKVQLREKETRTSLSADTMPTYLAQTEAALQQLLAELFDPNVPFDQTPHLKTCSYCDYKNICGR